MTFLKELGTKQFVQPRVILVDQNKPDSCQLRIKSDYDRELTISARHKHLTAKKDKNNDYLIIFKP
jgi:hypothetical protein